MRLIAIDPGVHHCGVAVFDDGRLNYAQLVKDNAGDLIHRLTVAVDIFHGTRVVIEKMMAPSGRAFRGKTSDILDVCVMIGRIYEWARQDEACPEIVKWKGGETKDVTRNRCIEKLSDEELLCVDLPGDKKRQTDVWDAVGIGLWALKR